MSRRSCKRPLPSVVAQTVLRSGLVLLLVPELAVVLLELPGLSLDFQYWLYPRQRPDLLVQPPREVSAGGRGGSVGDVLQGRRTSSGFTADAAVASDSEPFVDDGMFDPRRDYWGDRSSGSTMSSSAPASQNWASAARGLASTSSDCGTASSSEPCCIECFGLSYCDVLNGYKVEDKYFPGEPTILGSCENVEERASRLDVFGASKTFRDTEACREMVADYTCLWWGSNNEMYDNRCGVEAQVYPCRSYCVQLAKTCANNVVEWLELCRSIDCPPTSEECMPGPYTQDPDEACYLYEYHSPLNVGTRMSSGQGTMLGVIVASAVGALALWRATFDASFDNSLYTAPLTEVC